FDFNIRCRRDELDLRCGDRGNLITENGDVLLEIKISNSMPVWKASALAQTRAYPISYSKYGEYFQRELTGNDTDIGVYHEYIGG
ncbi:MAG: hypothetical protein ILP19_04850, partial [Oscillospiraceae bacterium]|nr:hypothetical protein [Oscillospiraceae bacterium]